MAELLHRGLRRAGAGVSDPVDEPDLRGRVLELSETESRAARVRLDVAAGASVAVVEILARPADGNSMGRSLADGNRQDQCPSVVAADRCAAGRSRPGKDHRAHAVRRDIAVLDRLPTWSVRGHGSASARVAEIPGPEDYGR